MWYVFILCFVFLSKYSTRTAKYIKRRTKLFKHNIIRITNFLIQGRNFRGIIQDFLASFKSLHETMIPAYETPKGKAAYDKVLNTLQDNFPQYVREIQGTADGAQVQFLHVRY